MPHYYLKVYKELKYLGHSEDLSALENDERIFISKVKHDSDKINTKNQNIARKYVSRFLGISRHNLKACKKCGGMFDLIYKDGQCICNYCSKPRCSFCGKDMSKQHPDVCSDHRCKGYNVHEWNYKPTPVFYGKGSWYYGWEMEVAEKSNSNVRGREDLAYRWNTMGSVSYNKQDGSVSLERVFHPMSFSYIRNNQNVITSTLKIAQDMGYSAWDVLNSNKEGKCGSHIHVSRTIGKLTIYKIIELFRTEGKTQDFLLAVSGRKTLNSTYTNYNKMASMPNTLQWIKHGNGHDDRYMPINLESKHTVEFRVFRASLNPERINMYFEFLQCMITWARETSIKNINLKSFLAYSRANRKRYRIWYKYITTDKRIRASLTQTDIEEMRRCA